MYKICYLDEIVYVSSVDVPTDTSLCCDLSSTPGSQILN